MNRDHVASRRLQETRKLMGLTQFNLAAGLGIAGDTLRDWERYGVPQNRVIMLFNYLDHLLDLQQHDIQTHKAKWLG